VLLRPEKHDDQNDGDKKQCSEYTFHSGLRIHCRGRIEAAGIGGLMIFYFFLSLNCFYLVDISFLLSYSAINLRRQHGEHWVE
jgi:hypothetical protein